MKTQSKLQLGATFNKDMQTKLDSLRKAVKPQDSARISQEIITEARRAIKQAFKLGQESAK